MSSLFGLLHLGSAALGAQNAGVAVTSNNVANVSTAGYSRQRISLDSQLGTPLVGGVRAGAVERMSSTLLHGRIRDNTSMISVADAFASALLDVEAGMTAGKDLGSLTAGFFAGLSQASAAPTDPNVRDAAVDAGRALADGMHQQVATVESARQQANQRIREHLSDANKLMEDIARANKAVGIDDDPVLRDRRDQAAEKLVELVGGHARIDPDGQMRVTLTSGESLVDGPHAVRFTSARDPALGNMDRIDVVDGAHRRDVTAVFDGGRVAGELRMRDEVATAALAKLDALAFDISTRVNQVHRQNAGLDGVVGRNLFAAPSQVAGAAAAMEVDPALAADSTLLATSAAGAGTGNNEGALALVALRDQPLASGGTRTFVDAGIDIAADVGRAAADAMAERDFFGVQGEHLAALRDAASGVSLQEEMSNLSQFQHAAEAQVRFLSTVDALLGSIIEGL